MSHSKVALVTGAGSGIGKAAALSLSRAGYSLVLVGRRRSPLEETAAELAPAKSLVVQCDVSDSPAVEDAFRQVKSEFGRLDVLFNNAGMNVPGVPIDMLEVDDWRRCVDVNLTGSFLCARQAFALMRHQTPKGGRIINNGSISAQSPRPNSTAYTATKHAITGLTKCLSLDGRAHDIACGQIDIGNANTDLAAKFPLGVPQASGDIRPEPVFDVERCGEAVAYMAGLPLDANIQFLTIMATKMPLVGRG
ncbi:MAG: SDR family oxidoreductase [Rhodobacteraceae bacterium]|nr:SDR family oxidoreductase [Paracoccaceae bacterium]